MADAVVVDFSNVKDASEINPRNMPEGDYLGKIIKYEKGKSNNGNDMITFLISLEGKRNATYPYHCTLTEKSLWKLRNLLQAAGIKVPKKKLKVDPSRVVGKLIGMELTDDEYEGRMKSIITAVFSPDEVEPEDAEYDKDEDDEDEDVEDEDEDIEEEKPKKKKAAPKKSSKKTKKKVDEDEDVDEDDLDELDLDEV